MSFKNLMFSAVASALVAVPAFAQETAKPAPEAPAKPAAEAKPAEPPKPKFNPEDRLKLIPDYLGEYTVDGKVVKVDTKKLKEGLRAELEMAAKSGADIKPEMITQLLPRMAEQLVMEQILPLEAAKKGFKPDLDKIRKQIADFKKQGSEEQFKQFLQMQGCKDKEEFVAKIAPRDAIQQYIKSIEDAVVIDDKAVKEHYDKNAADMKYYTCSHILAAFDAKNPRNDKITPEMEAAALAKIKDILAKLAKGEKFEELAKQHSDCPSGKEGGKLGDYNPDQKMPQGQMVPEFTEAFNGLKPGETTTAPVKTQFGYHIIKASDVIVRTLEEVAPQIREMLKNEQLQQKVPAIIEQIKKDFSVKLYTDATK